MQTPLPLLRSTEGAQHHKAVGSVFQQRSATCLGQYEMALAQVSCGESGMLNSHSGEKGRAPGVQLCKAYESCT